MAQTTQSTSYSSEVTPSEGESVHDVAEPLSLCGYLGFSMCLAIVVVLVRVIIVVCDPRLTSLFGECVGLLSMSRWGSAPGFRSLCPQRDVGFSGGALGTSRPINRNF